jgi:hypothetical protein
MVLANLIEGVPWNLMLWGRLSTAVELCAGETCGQRFGGVGRPAPNKTVLIITY